VLSIKDLGDELAVGYANDEWNENPCTTDQQRFRVARNRVARASLDSPLSYEEKKRDQRESNFRGKRD
jgi:hypothetical protein